jgi:predicted nuclease of predicted toxin-antitoxin system
MKLLFDENLSPRLVSSLEDLFPGSAHVHALNLGAADDSSIWGYAKDNGYTLVTKDADYNEMSTLRGAPPHVVWIRRGNCTTSKIIELLMAQVSSIRELETTENVSVLVLY